MGPRSGQAGVAVPHTAARAANLAELLAARADAIPDALAFAGAGERVTWGALRDQAGAVAAQLAARGITPGDRIALCLPAGVGFVRAFFGLQRLGAVPYAFDPGAPAVATVARVRRGRPAAVLVAEDGDDLAAALDAAGLRRIVPEHGGDAGAAAAPDHAAGTGDVAFLQPTSGTSGEPRLAMVSHRSVLASLDIAFRFLSVGPEDVLVSWVPPWHDLGLMRFVLGPIFFGVPCHLVRPAIRTLPEWLATLEGARGTVTGAPDFAYRLAVRLAGSRRFDLSSLRVATDGGEPVRRTTVEAFESRFGVPGVVRPGYGLAEATLGVAGVRPGEPLVVDGRGNVGCGRALPGVEVRIVDPVDGVGEIAVRGPTLFSGYFGAPEETAAVVRDGWLHTGDVGRLDDDGRLYVLGRRRALLKRGGAPLAPRELEEAAERAAGVRSAAAVAGPSTEGASSEEIVLVVEVDPASGRPPDEVATAAGAAVEAALGFVPSRVLAAPPRAIPRTVNGKIRYGELAASVAAGHFDADSGSR